MAVSDKALSEFLAEAQEIVDALSNHLLRLDEQRDPRGDAEPDPELLNECFRGVHSLKGLAGMFGVAPLADAAHRLETVLDHMRLGRMAASADVIDLLFEAVELFGRIIGAVAEGGEVDADRVAAYLARLDAAAAVSDAGDAGGLGDFDLPDAILSVLTEYEEHRLAENIKRGRRIYLLSAAFDLMDIDKGLERVKARIKPIGEVISYLPSADSIDDTAIQLDVLVGAAATAAEVRAAVDDPAVEVTEVRRKGDRRARAEPPPDASRSDAGAAGAPEPPRAAGAPEPASAARSRAAAPPAPPAVAADDLGTLRSVTQTVRVDIRKLDALMNAVSELTIVHSGLQGVLDRIASRLDLADEARALTREVRALERRLAELQTGILEVRMVPMRQVFDKLTRVVRRISRESGKEIRLDIFGADTELDKLIVEDLSDPLMHIIRNAIDHGIEMPSVREAAGKPPVGTIRVGARPQGSRVVVTVADDGAGIDPARVVEAAVARGLIDPDAARDMADRDAFNLLFLPGMSTRERATELSGRGVGLDVVKTNIARLSGLIDVTSRVGEGTEFAITLPITLAIIQALVVAVAGRTYAIPLNSIVESFALARGDVQTVEGRQVCSLRQQTLLLCRLEDVFGLDRPAGTTRPDDQYVVVLGLAQHRIGLVVDELVGERDIVIKSLGAALADVPGIAGATELSHQQTVLVLDVPGLVEEALAGAGASEAA
ncbi:MAG: chemotaxis protein CheA [Deltaproteobacteria bacterium]|nr:MAG: chemotaxis protein CheA [Deltaproteobacteria bacterium]